MPKFIATIKPIEIEAHDQEEAYEKALDVMAYSTSFTIIIKENEE